MGAEGFVVKPLLEVDDVARANVVVDCASLERPGVEGAVEAAIARYAFGSFLVQRFHTLDMVWEHPAVGGGLVLVQMPETIAAPLCILLLPKRGLI